MSAVPLDTDALYDAVYRQLTRVIDPEVGLSIIKLGLVYDLRIVDGAVEVVMTLTTRGCPLQAAITEGVRKVVAELPWVRSVQVKLVWEPAWHPGMIR
jgi:metal-sulfur cluster biosynthetic enzyme